MAEAMAAMGTVLLVSHLAMVWVAFPKVFMVVVLEALREVMVVSTKHLFATKVIFSLCD